MYTDTALSIKINKVVGLSSNVVTSIYRHVVALLKRVLSIIL